MEIFSAIPSSVTRKSLTHTVRGNGSLPVVGAVFWGLGELCKVGKDSCGYLWKTGHLGNCWKTANIGKEEKHSTRCLKSILWSGRRQAAAGFPGHNRDEGFGDVDSCWVKKSDVLVVRQGRAETVSQRSSKNVVVWLGREFWEGRFAWCPNSIPSQKRAASLLNTVFLHRSQKQTQKLPNKTWNSIHH